MKKIFKSIFSKLLLIYTAGLLLVPAIFIILSMNRINNKEFDFSQNNAELYAKLLTKEIGTPPDINKASELSLQYGIQIRIESDMFNWNSSDRDDENIIHNLIDNSLFKSLINNEIIYNLEKDGILYKYKYSELSKDNHLSIITYIEIILVFILVLIVNFLLVRHMLKPLGIIHAKAKKLKVGEWDQRIPVIGNDELSDLSKTLNEMAEHIQNYIESIHNLILSVSHELRSPLSRMNVAKEFIIDENLKNMFKEEIESLNYLIENILDIKRLETDPNQLSLEVIDLNLWFKDFVESYSLRDVNILFIKNNNEITIDADPVRFELVIRNIVENSIKYANAEGLKIYLQDSTTLTSIVIEDSGPGICSDEFKNIGKPFFIQNRQNGGFGLGFSIVFAVMNAHRGRVNISNKTENGLKVKLDFIKLNMY